MIGAIYIIRSKCTDEVYYGSTKQPLSIRLNNHRQQYKQYLKGKSNHCKSYDILKFADACIELVEEVTYENKKELLEREAFYIKNNPCVNIAIPNQTPKEYRQAHKEELKEKRKIYNETHKEERAELFRDWAERNKEDRKEYMKKWREENKDKLKQYQETRKNKD